MKKIRSKSARVLSRLCVVFQTLKGSLLRSQRWNSAEIRTHPSFNSCPHYLKNEEDPIKNEGARVLTSLLLDFSDAQGQLTPKSAAEFRQNSNSFKLLLLSSLPARMKKIHSKKEELEC